MATVVATDYAIAANGDITYTGTTTNNTVIEFHRWLGTLMDDAAAAGNDVLDITDSTASERQTDNIIVLNPPYNITDDLATHLYDGSIVQKGGDEIYDGILCFAPAGIPLEIIQNGAKATNFWGTTYNANAAAGISHRFMLKVRTAGADIDGRRIIGQTRDLGFQYSEFVIGSGTVRGNNVLALSSAVDLNNATAAGTLAGYTGITNTTEGYASITIGGVAYNFYSEWNTNQPTRSMNDFYERMKWLTRGTDGDKSASTLYGLNGELFRGPTHEVNIASGTGTWAGAEELDWVTGTGQLLAVDNTAAASATKLWLQLLTGVAPIASDVLTGQISGATATQTGSATSRALSFPFVGASTGTNIIGGYGVGIEAADLTASDKVFDLTNTLRTPPNNVTFTVGGLVSTEDQVLVAPLGYRFQYDTEASGPFLIGSTLTFTGASSGTAYLSYLQDEGTTGWMQVRILTGAIPLDLAVITSGAVTAVVNGDAVPCEDPRQLTLNTTLVSGTETAIVCNSAIPLDTPTPTGTVRVQLDTNIYRTVAYTSWTGSTFTIASSDWSGVNTATGGATEATANSVFISYVDKQATAVSEGFTGVYQADRNLFIRVRDGKTTPIKTFETTGVLSSAGGSTTAIRTSDA